MVDAGIIISLLSFLGWFFPNEGFSAEAVRVLRFGIRLSVVETHSDLSIFGESSMNVHLTSFFAPLTSATCPALRP
jgi:hypothetical protein